MKLPRSLASVLRRAALGLCAASILAGPALATWSIVAVNTKTGEVCIASATCIEGFFLQAGVALVHVGKGAAACQSLIDIGTVNRMKIWDMMDQGFTPDQMLERLLATDNSGPVRQYGIVTMDAFPLSYTGPLCGEAKYGVAGVVDDIRYAIQGNVLTGVIVVYNAEQALISTPGDMSQKVMAAMEAARVMGGDGRCSCDINVPWHCGAPPPSFVYSSYTAFIVVSRMGDVEGICQEGSGCANGQYYLDLQAVSDATGPEPVLALEQAYPNWRSDQHGFADHILTTVTPGAQTLPADGVSRTTVDVQLRDIDGYPVVHQPATLVVSADYHGLPVARVGLVTDHGGGHFSFQVRANAQPGQGKWKLEVVHGQRTVRLWPDLSIRVDPVSELHSEYDTVSAAAGATVPLVLNVEPGNGGAPYIMLASASGTSPGQVFEGLDLPLNPDALFLSSSTQAGSARFPHTAGLLDPTSHAQGAFVVPPMLLATYIGRRIDWCAVVHGVTTHATNLAGFDVVP